MSSYRRIQVMCSPVIHRPTKLFWLGVGGQSQNWSGVQNSKNHDEIMSKTWANSVEPQVGLEQSELQNVLTQTCPDNYSTTFTRSPIVLVTTHVTHTCTPFHSGSSYWLGRGRCLHRGRCGERQLPWNQCSEHHRATSSHPGKGVTTRRRKQKGVARI